MTNVVYLEKTDIGATLTTWIYCAAWQLFALERAGLRGYIHWPKDPLRSLRPCYDAAHFTTHPNMFSWYFEQPHVADQDAPPRQTIWTWEDAKPLLNLGDHQLYGLPIPELKKFYRENIRLNQDVERRGEALVAKYSIDFSKTIGVTWRGTDSIIDGRPRMPIETYFPFIDDILNSDRPCRTCDGKGFINSDGGRSFDVKCPDCHGSRRASNRDLRIMATAEEEGILEPLLKRYPQAFTIAEFFMTPRGHQKLGDNPERFSKLSGYERGMQPALMVYLFSRCAHYIKNRSSTGAVASWLSSGRIVCLAHPENLGHGWDITKAEINGAIVELNR